jgi:uncharacterized protein (TIGR03118 family)
MHVQSHTRSASQLPALLLGAAVALLSACGGSGSGATYSAGTTTGTAGMSASSGGSSAYGGTGSSAPAPASAYSLSKLVSDGQVAASLTDPNLVNAWGIVFAPNAPVWVANNGTQTSTIYNGIGQTQLAAVSIPAGSNGDADPTGIVYNGTTDFVVTEGAHSAAASFIFDGDGGTISGWAGSVDQQKAIVMYDDGSGGAVYKGLAIATDSTGTTRLYATDFHNSKVDVFDGTFAKTTTTGGFTDPTLPAGYAPFGIQTLTVQNQTLIYVSYAKQDSASHDELVGAGLGLVDVYDAQGTLQTHLIATGGALNAPWGIALAPAGFGTLSNELLIGNFGDGWINAYDPATGTYVGALSDATGTAIAIPGLWGIAFGNGVMSQPTTTLFFAAGPNNTADGLYGRIDLGATAPDVVAPTATITAPAQGATVSGSVTITATASDNVGVTAVQFFAGTTLIGTASTPPYSVSWDSTTSAAGSVPLTAQAQDAAGNVGASAAVTVTVNNAAPPPPAQSFAQLQTQIFTPICSGCHSGTGTSLPGSMNLTAGNAYASLVNVASVEQPSLKRVNPGNPNSSYLVQKLEGASGISGQRMPLGGPYLDQATINEVVNWITQGAANN